MKKDDGFDTFLRTRFVPDAPSNMAARIIEASLAQKKTGRFDGLQRWVCGFLDGFIIPQPALALGLFLLLGLSLGIFSDQFTFMPEVSTDDYSLVFQAGDVFEVGDFL